MHCYFSNCQICESGDLEVLFASVCRGHVDPVEEIVICRACGCIFKNPIVEKPSDEYYSLLAYGDGSRFAARFDSLAELLEAEKAIPGESEFHLDIGSGPGWFTQRLYANRRPAKVISIDPVFDVAAHAKKLNPSSTALPCRLDQTTLPEGTFKLITACGVDYLFYEYMADLRRISRLLSDDGLFYVERSVLLPHDAWAEQPILGVEDLFGVNRHFRTFFNEDQFVDIISSVFDVVQVVERTYATFEYRGRERRSRGIGVFCKKKVDAGAHRPLQNFYQINIEHLKRLAIDNSLEDLEIFMAQGVRSVAICGGGPDARALGDLVEQHNLCNLNGYYIIEEDSQGCLNGKQVTILQSQKTVPADVVLIASLKYQNAYDQKVTQLRWHNRMFSVFAETPEQFETITSHGNRIQMRPFLPFKVAENDGREARIKLAAAARAPVV